MMMMMVCDMWCVWCCRYPGASAAAHARYQQEDDGGAQSVLRLLGEGADQAQYRQGYVQTYLPSNNPA